MRVPWIVFSLALATLAPGGVASAQEAFVACTFTNPDNANAWERTFAFDPVNAKVHEYQRETAGMIGLCGRFQPPSYGEGETRCSVSDVAVSVRCTAATGESFDLLHLNRRTGNGSWLDGRWSGSCIRADDPRLAPPVF